MLGMIDKFQAAVEHAERLSRERGVSVQLRVIRGGIEIEASHWSHKVGRAMPYFNIGQQRDALIAGINELVAKLEARASTSA